MKKLLTLTLLATSAFAAEGYKVINKYKIGGTGGWDYVAVDQVNRRIYASHATAVEVLDADSGKVVGQIKDLHGVHGIAVAPDLNKGFITNGTSDSVTVFNLKTLEKMGEPASGGKGPDAVCYEPKTKRVFAMNHSGNNATAIDANTNEIVGTFPLGPAPEFCVVDGAGKVYVNLEGSSEVLEIDAAKPAVTRRVELTPSEGPTGLAIDVKNKKLFAVCGGSKTMAVVDIPTFKVIAAPPIGAGTDAAGFDPGTGLAFSSNSDATLTIVKLVNGKYEAVDNVPTVPRARTMAVDEKLHRVYLLAAEYGAPVEGKDGKKRPQVVPDSFHVLVVGK
jgi:DNA-binding beta-propeller fold protein YncE